MDVGPLTQAALPPRGPRRPAFSQGIHHASLPRSPARPVEPLVQRLEDRRLLTAVIIPADSAWHVRGDVGGVTNDLIVVEAAADDPNMLVARVNGQVVDTVAAAGVTRLEVDAGAGNDWVTVALGSAGRTSRCRCSGGPATTG